MVPISSWLSHLELWLKESPIKEAPNDTLEFVHPQDVALMHIAILEQHPLAASG
jgi:hypothetical protein